MRRFGVSLRMTYALLMTLLTARSSSQALISLKMLSQCSAAHLETSARSFEQIAGEFCNSPQTWPPYGLAKVIGNIELFGIIVACLIVFLSCLAVATVQ